MTKIKRFGKVINDNPIAMAIDKEQQIYFDEIEELENRKRSNL